MSPLPLEWASPDMSTLIGQDDMHMVSIDMGLDGTLTSHIERVEDEFDMACQSAI